MFNNYFVHEQQRYLKFSKSKLRLAILAAANQCMPFNIHAFRHIDVTNCRKKQMINEAIKLGFIYKFGRFKSTLIPNHKNTNWYCLNLPSIIDRYQNFK